MLRLEKNEVSSKLQLQFVVVRQTKRLMNITKKRQRTYKNKHNDFFNIPFQSLIMTKLMLTHLYQGNSFLNLYNQDKTKNTSLPCADNT